MPHETARELNNIPPPLIGMIAGLFGVGLFVVHAETMPARKLLTVLLSGLICAALLPSFAVPALLHFVPGDWWPRTEWIYSLCGLIFGLLGFKVIATVLAIGEQLPGVAGAAFSRVFGGGEK